MRTGRRARGIVGSVVLAGALLALALPALAGASPLTTGRLESFAGTGFGTGELSGDGGPATFAGLWGPRGVAADAAGNLYIADQVNGRVRRVARDGNITTFAGGHGSGSDTGDAGPATAAALSPPSSLAAASGNVYLLGAPEDDRHTWARVVDAAGTIRAFAGSATPGFSGDGGPAASALLDHPSAIATDPQGDVYVAERGHIRKVSPNGIISTIAGTGTYGFSGDGGPATAAGLDRIPALAADGQGNVYLAGAGRVRKVSASGTISTVAGTGAAGFSGDDGPATQARIGNPQALAVDTDGVLFLADPISHRVRAVTPGGAITTIAGTGRVSAFPTRGAARQVPLNLPSGLAVDGHGHLFISDFGRNAVLRFTRGLAPAALGRCSRASARQTIEQRGLGHPSDTVDPVAQAFCGPFTGRRGSAMVVSLSLPSCGLSYGWLVFRSVHGTWKPVLNVRHGAYLTRSGRSILEWQGVLAPRDAHCFPSSARVRAWSWTGSHFVHGKWHRKPRLPTRLPGFRRTPS